MNIHWPSFMLGAVAALAAVIVVVLLLFAANERRRWAFRRAQVGIGAISKLRPRIISGAGPSRPETPF